MSSRPKTNGNHGRSKKETFGINVRQLKLWNQLRQQQQMDTESVKQELAVAKVRAFLDAIGK
ncbi:hypothetical protein EON65_31865 [archaeon]|nr:MAG: hypothetical protein EON65_31865 [archaeon]